MQVRTVTFAAWMPVTCHLSSSADCKDLRKTF